MAGSVARRDENLDGMAYSESAGLKEQSSEMCVLRSRHHPDLAGARRCAFRRVYRGVQRHYKLKSSAVKMDFPCRSNTTSAKALVTPRHLPCHRQRDRACQPAARLCDAIMRNRHDGCSLTISRNPMLRAISFARKPAPDRCRSWSAMFLRRASHAGFCKRHTRAA